MSEPKQSSSFDSSNSFYSTDSSSQNSQISQSGVIVADEPFFDQKYQATVAQKISEFLAEIQSDADFQSLISLPEVSVDTSVLHPFCFRVAARFPTIPAESAFALFADVQGRARWDAMCDSISVLKQIDPLTCIYHLKLKATWPSTARDSLAVAAFRKLEDGRFVSVAWSIVDDSLCPPDPSGSFIRMHTRISANLFTPSRNGGFILTQLIDGDPKGSIPSYLIKKVSSKSFPATMERIQQVIQQRNDPPNFYSTILADNLSTPESPSDVDPVTSELTEIRKRLQQIETKIEKSFGSESRFMKWAPLIISSISLILLLNINRKNK